MSCSVGDTHAHFAECVGTAGDGLDIIKKQFEILTDDAVDGIEAGVDRSFARAGLGKLFTLAGKGYERHRLHTVATLDLEGIQLVAVDNMRVVNRFLHQRSDVVIRHILFAACKVLKRIESRERDSRVDNQTQLGQFLLERMMSRELAERKARTGQPDRLRGHNFICQRVCEHAVLVDAEDNEQHQALLATMVGMIRPDRGNVMNKSANLLELEPGEVRGHRLGLVPQQYAVRDDMSAERNLVYAMDASGRTFLKPKPVIARELLHKVHFDVDTPNAPVGKLDVVEQRRVAIARAIACEAEVLIADEPTGGLNDDDSVELLQLLTSLTHGDPKRCVIILTESEAVANIAETIIKL